MASLRPRPPYSQEELEKLYPKNLELQLVQVVRDSRSVDIFRIDKSVASSSWSVWSCGTPQR
jgi:acid phosphatase